MPRCPEVPRWSQLRESLVQGVGLRGFRQNGPSGRPESSIPDPGKLPGSADRQLRQDHYGKWRRRESNTGPAILPEDAAAIGSAVSGEESGGCAESQGSGRASEDAGGSDACSSVARAPRLATLLAGIDAALVALKAGEVAVAAGHMRALAAVLQSHITHGTRMAYEPKSSSEN